MSGQAGKKPGVEGRRKIVPLRSRGTVAAEPAARIAETPLLAPPKYRVLIEVGTAHSPSAALELIDALIGYQLTRAQAPDPNDPEAPYYSGLPVTLSSEHFSVERA